MGDVLAEQDGNINIHMSHLNETIPFILSLDCVIFGYDEESLKILLLECLMPPFEGLPSLVGDLVKPDENFQQSANRILKKRTGLSDLYMEQVATFSEVNRHPLGRIVSTAYYSLVKVDEMNVDPSLNGAFWLDVNDIGDLAFDHNQIFEVCYERLKRTLREKPIGFSLLPERFTLKQLQALYEVILGIKLDKRNFRRKLRSLEILIEHEESETDVAHRPAKLYSFNKELYYARRSEGLNFDL